MSLQKYEYKTWDRHNQTLEEKEDTRKIIEIINDNDKEGWRHYLVDGVVHYFRREVKDRPKPKTTEVVRHEQPGKRSKPTPKPKK